MHSPKSPFPLTVLRRAWRTSRPRNLAVGLVVALSALAAIGAPIALGRGVSAIGIAEAPRELTAAVVLVAISYPTFWFLGSVARYFVLPVYSRIEQTMQSDVMAEALRDSLVAPSGARAKTSDSEISFAIDSLAAAYRDTLSGLYLSLLPTVVSLAAGLGAVVVLSGWRAGVILAGATALYLLASRRLIDTHQSVRSAFFAQNMRSFGVLSNSVGLWKEAKVYDRATYIHDRYRADRAPVEEAGHDTYRMTRRLQIAQGVILTLAISAIVVSIASRFETGTPQTAGLIVAAVGICVAAITPLQSIGFELSSIAVASSQFAQSRGKIRPPADDYDDDGGPQSPSFQQVAEAGSSSGRPVWVRGASGSGKTTLLESLLGLNGADGYDAQWLRRFTAVTYAQQSPAVLNAPAIDNTVFGRSDLEATGHALLTQLDLTEFGSTGERADHDVAGEDGGVSGGELQRIALARALTTPSGSLIVLDEPTSSLDRDARARVWDAIVAAARENTVVVATHDADAPVHDDDPQVRL